MADNQDNLSDDRDSSKLPRTVVLKDSDNNKINAPVKKRRIPDLPPTDVGHMADKTPTYIADQRQLNTYEDLTQYTTQHDQDKHGAARDITQVAVPVEDVEIHEQDGYYSTVVDPADVTVGTSNHDNTVPSKPYTKSFENQRFYSSRDGRYVFPFLESRQAYLVAQDDELDDVIMPEIARKTDHIFRRVWREGFGGLRTALSIVFVLLMEMTRFLVHDVIHTCIIRLIMYVGDFTIKPLLAALFNCLLLPVLVFIWNVLDAARKALYPVIVFISGIIDHVVRVLKAFRLVEITYVNGNDTKPSVTDSV